MPKRRQYAPSELTRLSTKSLMKIVKRESERINKQITRFMRRAEKAGFEPTSLYTEEQLQRPTRNLSGMSDIDLINLYEKMRGSDFTVTGVEKREQMREEIAEEIGIGAENAEEITPEYLESFIKAKRRAKSESALFYQILVKSVEYGVANAPGEVDAGYNDYGFFRTNDELAELTQTKKGRQQFIRNQLKRINDAIVKENKQRDAAGAEKLEKLSLAELKRRGYKHDITKAKKWFSK